MTACWRRYLLLFRCFVFLHHQKQKRNRVSKFLRKNFFMMILLILFKFILFLGNMMKSSHGDKSNQGKLGKLFGWISVVRGYIERHLIEIIVKGAKLLRIFFKVHVNLCEIFHVSNIFRSNVFKISFSFFPISPKYLNDVCE